MVKNKKRENIQTDLISVHKVESLIHHLRGQRVILDSDLATLYQVTTKRLNEQVKRNIERFPADFLFQLTQEEYDSLRSQNATSGHGGRRNLPFAFTEHGVVMAASLLKSKQAIDSSIFVVRAFIKLREFAVTYKDLAKKIASLEKSVSGHDKTIASIFISLKRLIEQPQAETKNKKREIGFTAKHEDEN